MYGLLLIKLYMCIYICVYIYIYIYIWEDEARRERIVEWNPPEEQLGLTIHQIRPNPNQDNPVRETKEHLLLARLGINQ